MARVSIFYDKDLKEQFFMVRGDERYARSTKVILEQGTTSSGSYDFSVVLSVNVLRDVGDSSIMIYDNNEPVGVITDWSSTDNEATITLNNLTYDVDHIFTAKYMGNDKCSPSLSNSITVNVHDTNRVSSILTITDNTTQFIPNDELTKTITLSNANNTAIYNVNQPIDIYYDGEALDGTYTTGDEGTVNFTISDVGDIGLHTIRVEYAGSEHLTSKIVSVPISVGYELEILSKPSLILKGVETSFEVLLKDCFGTPIPNTNIQMVDTYHSVQIEEVSTNSNGISTFTETINDANSDNGIQHYSFISTISNVSYETNVDVPYIIPSSITISSSTPQLYANESAVLSIQTNSRVEGTPIVLTGSLNETLYTDANGLAITTITGTGIGTKTINAQYGTISQSINLTDYIQYWQPKNNHNRNLVGNIMDLNNLFRTTTDSNGDWVFIVPNNIDYELVLSGFSTSKNAKFNFRSGINIYVENEHTYLNPSEIVTTNYGQQSHSNETWKVIRQDGTVSLYKGNTLLRTFENQEFASPSFSYEANYSHVTSSGENLIVDYDTHISTNFDFTKLTIRGI